MKILKKIIKLLLLLVVLSTLFSWFWTRYKRHAEVKAVLSATAKAQHLFFGQMGVYTLDWQMLSGVVPNPPKGGIYCLGGQNEDYQTSCTDLQTQFEIRLFEQTAMRVRPFVAATRKNDNYRGEYKLIQFYEEVPPRIYCMPGTQTGRNVCIGFADASKTNGILTASIKPTRCTKRGVCQAACPASLYQEACRTHTRGAVMTENYGYEGFKRGTLIEYDSEGFLTKIKYCSQVTPQEICKKGTEEIYNRSGQKIATAYCAGAFSKSGRCSYYEKREEYTYDEENLTRKAGKKCSGVRIDTQTGKCYK